MNDDQADLDAVAVAQAVDTMRHQRLAVDGRAIAAAQIGDKVTAPPLGDPGVATQDGATAVLQRLVEGGILTALTTTIVGGVGGYVMRVLKSSLLGTRLSRFYEEHEQGHANRVEALLRDIRASLDMASARGRTAYVLQEGP